MIATIGMWDRSYVMVMVMVMGDRMEPNSMSLYCIWQRVRIDESTTNGFVEFEILNMRDDVCFAFIESTGKSHVVRAISTSVKFMYPNQPLRVHWSLTQVPNIMR